MVGMGKTIGPLVTFQGRTLKLRGVFGRVRRLVEITVGIFSYGNSQFVSVVKPPTLMSV